jgi:hypothetical protein
MLRKAIGNKSRKARRTLRHDRLLATEDRSVGKTQSPPAVEVTHRPLDVRVSSLLEITLKVLLICAALFAYFQFSQNQKDLRTLRALEFVARFDGKEYWESRRTIDLALRQSLRMLGPNSIDSLTHQRVIRTLMHDWNRGEGIEQEVVQVAGLIGSLQACIEADLCDRQLSHAVLNGYAQTFWETFSVYFQDQRKSNQASTYGATLERFVIEARGTTK